MVFLTCTNVAPPQMVDDADLRRANKVKQHLSALYKSFNKMKKKKGRDLLLEKTLEGGSRYIEAVQRFRDDEKVSELVKSTAMAILRGHISRGRYNTCLGLIAARLMFS